jgi:phenylacetate-CoA ligase
MKLRIKILDFIGGSTIYEYYKLCSYQQYFDFEQINNYQNKELKKLINHAYNNVPYYRKIMDENQFTPKDINSKEDLKKFPILTKEIIRKNFEELKANNLSLFKPKLQRTGGATGHPLVFYSDDKSWSMHWALKFRSWEMGGYSIGEKVAFIGGTSIIPKDMGIKKRLWNWLNNFHTLQADKLNDDLINKHINYLIKKNIRILRGYPASIALIADYCIKQNIKLDIKLVISTADTLLNEHKVLITRAFNCNIIDSYGSADGGGNASTCLYNEGFHFSFESAIWEVIGKNEKIGELTLTSLTNYAMPFIRYQPGDVVEKLFTYEKCKCGRTLPRIKKLYGRSSDVIKLENGNTISSHAFSKLIKGYPVNQWQVIQEGTNIDLNIKVSNGFKSEDRKELMMKILAFCGTTSNTVRLNEVKELHTTINGKLRVIINKNLEK